MGVLDIQVALDRAGFSPGVIDGKPGKSLKAALNGFQAARGLKVTGTLDEPTRLALLPDGRPPATRELTIGEDEAAGPFTDPLPDDPAEQAKLPQLGYRNLIEKLAEKFHTTPETLIAINAPKAAIGAGAKLVFPNVLPSSRDYKPELPEAWRATLSALNVDANQPKGKRIVVDKSEEVLKVYDEADKLIAQFPATMGSGHDPLPIGNWTVKGAAYNPPFHYNPKLFWDADDSEEKQKLPPGPNGPVGVVWLDLSKPHYGIHGTPEPSKIGRTESHGCIRLTNWDAARLAMIISPGTPAKFQN